ncbi:hypothetical protein R83H12_00332 [Fibrobacteria bacterium R8-3-H12]
MKKTKLKSFFSSILWHLLYRFVGDNSKEMSDLFKKMPNASGDSKSAQHFLVRGILFDRVFRYNKAIANYNQAIKLEPDYEKAYAYRARAYLSKRDYDKAIANYDQVIKLKPDFAYAYYERGIAYYCKSDYDKAVADYNQAIKLNPDYASAYYERGLAYFYKGDFDKASADLNQAAILDDAYIGAEEWYSSCADLIIWRL